MGYIIFRLLICSALLWATSPRSSSSSTTTNGALATATISAATTSACSPSDLAALRSFAASFPAANFSDWQASDDCCTWAPSITCASSSASNNNTGSPHHHHQWRPVTELSLDVYRRGMAHFPIPFSLCNLSSLTSLRLTGGSHILSDLDEGLSGSIPHCIGTHLINLVHLDLNFNRLTGPIPQSLSRLQSLHSLELSLNSLSGPIPFFNTPLLQILVLCDNSFSGSIILLLHNSTLTSLSLLDLSDNSLSGEIPNFDPFCFPSLAALDLSGNSLSGSLPHSICGLKNLQELSLSSNLFSGSFNMCRKLNFTFLYVEHNQFVGPFPDWIGSLPNLQYLDLSYNNFNGSLPKSWKNLSLLESLGISGNSLAAPNPGATKLPSWFFTLPSLTDVSLSSLGLQATDLHCSSLLLLLQRFLSPESGPAYLDLSMNNISSDVLPCLSTSQPLSLYLSGNPLALNLNFNETIQLLPQLLLDLDMSSCGLRGRLSGSFFDHVGASIHALNLANNSLEGKVPAHLGNLSHLSSLDLSHNYFTGIAPLKNKFSSQLEILLSNNHLGGKLSSLLFNFRNISSCDFGNLDVSNNFLTGLIPPWLGQCIKYAYRLKFNNNHLEGLIPNELFQNVTSNYWLQILFLSNNQLTGKIPSSFKNLNHLKLLDLSHNRLKGDLETVILFSNASSNQYKKLRVLVLGYNDFTGSVPLSLAVIAPALQLIDFSNNHLTGMIHVHTLQNFSAFISNPSFLASPNISTLSVLGRGTLYEEVRINMKGITQSYQYVLQALVVIDLPGNNQSGPISTGLGELSGLVALNLSRNRFSGLIPSDLGKLVTQLQALDLSYNELCGPIPASFHNLTNLEVFNVSYNPSLIGPIPKNQPQFENANSYIGDPNLCGDPILPSCSVVHEIPSTQSDMSNVGGKSNGFKDWIDEWISIPGLCLGIVVGIWGALYALAIMYPM